MSYKIKDVIKIIEDFAPLSLQAEYDNSGLMLGDIEKELTGVMLALDTTEAVVEDAVNQGCNLIVEHHPSIFYPIKRIDYRLPSHKAIVKAIKNDIAVYAAHTNMDFAQGGLNDYVAQKLKRQHIYCINGDTASARLGQPHKEFTLGAFADFVSVVLGDKNVITIGEESMQVNKVGVINGAGGSDADILLALKEEGANIFVTADVKYAFARFAKELNYGIICFGHYDSEICFADLTQNLLKSKISDIKIVKTNKCLNPYNNRR